MDTSHLDARALNTQGGPIDALSRAIQQAASGYYDMRDRSEQRGLRRDLLTMEDRRRTEGINRQDRQRQEDRQRHLKLLGFNSEDEAMAAMDAERGLKTEGENLTLSERRREAAAKAQAQADAEALGGMPSDTAQTGPAPEFAVDPSGIRVPENLAQGMRFDEQGMLAPPVAQQRGDILRQRGDVGRAAGIAKQEQEHRLGEAQIVELGNRHQDRLKRPLMQDFSPDKYGRDIRQFNYVTGKWEAPAMADGARGTLPPEGAPAPDSLRTQLAPPLTPADFANQESRVRIARKLFGSATVDPERTAQPVPKAPITQADIEHHVNSLGSLPTHKDRVNWLQTLKVEDPELYDAVYAALGTNA